MLKKCLIIILIFSLFSISFSSNIHKTINDFQFGLGKVFFGTGDMFGIELYSGFENKVSRNFSYTYISLFDYACDVIKIGGGDLYRNGALYGNLKIWWISTGVNFNLKININSLRICPFIGTYLRYYHESFPVDVGPIKFDDGLFYKLGYDITKGFGMGFSFGLLINTKVKNINFGIRSAYQEYKFGSNATSFCFFISKSLYD